MGLCGSKLSAADMAFRKAAVDRETTILRGLNLTQEDGLILFKVSERKRALHGKCGTARRKECPPAVRCLAGSCDSPRWYSLQRVSY